MNVPEPDSMPSGIDPNGLSRACGLVDEGLARGLYIGAALYVSRGGIMAALHCVGHTDETRAVPIDEHILFDLASLTKPMVTAPSMLLLDADGKLGLDQPVTDFLADRNVEHLKDVTPVHLLTHTSGLPAWRDLHGGVGTREHALDTLFATPLDFRPGTRYEYSCLGYILLGLVVEAVSGVDLSSYARGRIFERLGMRNTLFNPSPNGSIASTGDCPRRGKIPKGVVHDLNAFTLGGVSGNAGLFGSVMDAALFCHSITLDRHSGVGSLWPPTIRNRIFANALAQGIGGHTLGGWFVHPNPLLPVSLATESTIKATIGHSGFTGTAIIIEEDYELCSVLLTNRVCGPKDVMAFRALRRSVFDAVIGAIV